MHYENLEERREEVDVVEHLGGAVQAPAEEVRHGRQSVCLEHVVAVFS